MMMSFSALPMLPSAVNCTSPAFMLMSPVKVLALPVILNLPVAPVFALKSSPPELFEMTPPRVTVPVFPKVKVLTALPRFIASENVRLPELLASVLTVESSPIWTFPPMMMPPVYLPVKSRVALPATVPPLRLSVPPAPMALTPCKMTVPAFNVNPPAYVPPPKARTPAPVLMNPVPTAVDIVCEPKFRRDPTPMSRVLTAPPVPQVPDAAEKVTVALAAKVIFPTLPVPPPVNV